MTSDLTQYVLSQDGVFSVFSSTLYKVATIAMALKSIKRVRKSGGQDYNIVWLGAGKWEEPISNNGKRRGSYSFAKISPTLTKVTTFDLLELFSGQPFFTLNPRIQGRPFPHIGKSSRIRNLWINNFLLNVLSLWKAIAYSYLIYRQTNLLHN